MFGLLEKLGTGLETIGLAVEGAVVNAKCATDNFIVDRATGTKCMLLEHQATKEKEAAAAAAKAAQIVNAENAEKINKLMQELSEGGSNAIMQEVQEELSEVLNDYQKSLATANSEQLSETIQGLDVLLSIILTMRQEAAAVVGQNTPLLYPAAPTSLMQQAHENGGVIDGRHIIQQFQNPVDMNAVPTNA